MALLTDFLLRLVFGMAGAMATVSPRLVSSGYFRNHVYVTLGLSALAALLSKTTNSAAFVPAIVAAAASYVASVFWLYEKPRLGVAALVVIAAAALVGAMASAQPSSAGGLSEASSDHSNVTTAQFVHVTTSGALLGSTMAAMLLGHWYLNAPGMKLAPLKRLLILMGIAVVVHAIVCGWGLALEIGARDQATSWWLFVALRWLFGLFGVAALIVMAWKTIAIPNTQAATGILYVAVIGTFVGETMSLLLSSESLFPL